MVSHAKLVTGGGGPVLGTSHTVFGAHYGRREQAPVQLASSVPAEASQLRTRLASPQLSELRSSFRVVPELSVGAIHRGHMVLYSPAGLLSTFLISETQHRLIFRRFTSRHTPEHAQPQTRLLY